MKISNLTQLLEAIWLRKVSFVTTFFGVFLVTYAILAGLDFLPEPPSNNAVVETTTENAGQVDEETIPATSTATTTTTTNSPAPSLAYTKPIKPESITIDRLDRTVDVINPVSRAIEDLDAALLYGVVRHPDSATLDQTGNVFILGHSSYLPTVNNSNFQAFNGIQTLRFGDTIRLQAEGMEYIYRVDRVYRADASEVVVPIAGTTKRLVLATCNSFGSVDDRFIVEADLVETKSLLAIDN